MVRAYQMNSYNQDSNSEYEVEKDIKERNLSNKHKKTKAYDGIRQGNWTNSQNLLYLRFLQKHKKYFEEQELRKRIKIFSKMSKVIKTRTRNQCRGHHQKLMQRFFSVEHIIQNFAKTISQNFITQKKSNKKQTLNKQEEIKQYVQINSQQSQLQKGAPQKIALQEHLAIPYQNLVYYYIPHFYIKYFTAFD